MIITRQESLNYQEVWENIVKVTANYLTEHGIKTMVLGVSGGLDSTVSAAICKEVNKRTGIPLIGISLPASTNTSDENESASFVGEEFCNEFQINNIQGIYEQVENVCGYIEPVDSAIAKGNIKVRLRMIILYDIASKRNGIVIDTDNLTEHYTGFFSINGDVGDFNPLGNLWKTEVYGLAQWLLDNVYKGSKALKAAIDITPTDGNGVSSSDMDQIMPGFNYSDVDTILRAWVPLNERIKEYYLKDGINQKGTGLASLCKRYGEENVMRVINRNIRSEFKRLPHPIPVDCFRGTIEKVRNIEI